MESGNPNSVSSQNVGGAQSAPTNDVTVVKFGNKAMIVQIKEPTSSAINASRHFTDFSAKIRTVSLKDAIQAGNGATVIDASELPNLEDPEVVKKLENLLESDHASPNELKAFDNLKIKLALSPEYKTLFGAEPSLLKTLAEATLVPASLRHMTKGQDNPLANAVRRHFPSPTAHSKRPENAQAQPSSPPPTPPKPSPNSNRNRMAGVFERTELNTIVRTGPDSPESTRPNTPPKTPPKPLNMAIKGALTQADTQAPKKPPRKPNPNNVDFNPNAKIDYYEWEDQMANHAITAGETNTRLEELLMMKRDGVEWDDIDRQDYERIKDGGKKMSKPAAEEVPRNDKTSVSNFAKELDAKLAAGLEAKQAKERLDLLLSKQSEGSLTFSEGQELAKINVDKAEKETKPDKPLQKPNVDDDPEALWVRSVEMGARALSDPLDPYDG